MQPVERPRLVVVGNGMAGVRFLEELVEREGDGQDGAARHEITVLGAEPRPTYNRILLSPVLAGERRFEDIVTHDHAWYEARGIRLRTGVRVSGIDRAARLLATEDGERVAYDRLVLATGSHPIVLPVPGRDLPGVLAFRDVADVDAMALAAARGGRAVVIGGGLLGLEAASGLAARGMDVTVVHLMGTLMERQIDETAGGLLARELERRGLTVVTCASTRAIVGTERAEGVALEDGRTLPADLVVMAIGIRPNADLARAAGLEVGRGVVVDDGMATSDPAILALGECAEHRGRTYGLVAPLYEMAKVAAARLAGDETAAFGAPALATKLKVTGVHVYSAGDFAAGPDCDDIVFRDAARGVYKRVVLADDRVKGAVLYGDVDDGPWLFQLMRDGTDVRAIRDTIVLGPVATVAAGGDGAAAASPGDFVLALPAEAEVCGCNGVAKGRICDAIRSRSLRTLGDVRAHTKASASCGSCTPQVEALLRLTLGANYAAAPVVAPVCGCTDLGHDEVRRRIAAERLVTLAGTMEALGWRTPDGCAKCRPALNYYLLCAWPGEYVDDATSRIANERVHANIQKDGTYSVVPRMWGGLTNARELRAIADVVERHRIPTVKVTGGQRIDLLGVRKEQLPAVWADLSRAGLVSGHAYGKALRTVKTCVGSEWCRFGTQDSTAMGVRLERMTWGSWTPHKVKMAVSGCPRNCAEATIKDFGVVAVESGWELHVGGNGGMKVRATDLLTKVATEDEVLEHCGAFLQLYREEARYLERTAPWIERVGLAHVKALVVDDAASRAALHARFLGSQREVQHDPWAERAAGHDAGTYHALAEVG